jgi:predicted ATP-grasp superfamily ATP-dependent carboligase
MRVFVYEYITGGGCWHAAGPPTGSLLVEGRAMLQALASDLARLPEVDVLSTRDTRLPLLHPPGCEVTAVASKAEEDEAIRRLAAQADATILIAPETDDALFHRVLQIERSGSRLLSPSAEFVTIAGDKNATAARLAAHGVRVPSAIAVESMPDFRLPLVVKPPDGCGSVGIEVIYSRARLQSRLRNPNTPLRVEEFVPGLPVSVAVLCGPRERVALPACRQILSADDRCTYLGGSMPLAVVLDERAHRLALAALAALPPTNGYVGVDLVLGEAADGSEDAVIEINPRLTTSYVGLRASCRENLAGGMLSIAIGESASLSFDLRTLEFDPNGSVRLCQLEPAAAGERTGDSRP